MCHDLKLQLSTEDDANVVPRSGLSVRTSGRDGDSNSLAFLFHLVFV